MTHSEIEKTIFLLTKTSSPYQISSNTTHVPVSKFSDNPQSLKEGQLIGFATPVHKDAVADMLDSEGPVEIEMSKGNPILHSLFFNNVDAPVIHNDMSMLDNGQGISEYCLVSEKLDASPNAGDLAALIDASDRDPPPHGVEPTWEGFDVAKDENGVPHETITKVLSEHMDSFSMDGKPGRINDGTEISIKTGDKTLPSEPLRPVSQEKAKIQRETLEQLLDWGVIEPSESPAPWPVVIVNQHGKWRFCVDYRKLNSVTKKDQYPMQRTDSIFNTLGGKKYFSSLDAVRGFHQLPVKAEDWYKTAFITQEGLYQYITMPFGLCNAPAAFQRFMNRLLGSMRWRSALVYIDDIIVYTNTLKEHAKELATLLKTARFLGLLFSPSKCHFGYDQLNLLGRVISREGIMINRHRAQSIINLSAPRNFEDLYHLIGLFNFYRIFVYNFAEIMKPLTSLTIGLKVKKNDHSWKQLKIKWGEEQEKSLKLMKHILSNPPVLAYPDWSKPFILHVDALRHAFAFALHQAFDRQQGDTFSLSANDGFRSSWLASLKDDSLYQQIIKKLEAGEGIDQYEISKNVLIFKSIDGVKACVPKAMIQSVFHDFHDAVGHPGFRRSWALISAEFIRPNLHTLLKNYVDQCPTCQRTKSSRLRPEGEMPPEIDIVPIAFHSIAMDFIVNLPKSGASKFDCILTVVDLFTKYCILIPMHSTYSVSSVARDFIQHVVRRGFLPKRIVSDNDKVFISKFWNQVSKQLGFELRFTSPYHPQSDPAERYNQTAEGILRAYCCDNPHEWSDKLVFVQLAMNSLKSESTKHSPQELLYVNASGPFKDILDLVEEQGRSVSDANDFITMAQERVKEAQSYIRQGHMNSKRYHDAQHSGITEWKVGDRAWILLERCPIRSLKRTKFSGKKLGPYEVLEVHTRSLRLSLPASLKINPIFSIQHVKRARLDKDFGRSFTPEPIEASDGEFLWEIDQILDTRLYGRQRFCQYKVQWKGHESIDNSWLFEDDLLEDGCQDVIKAFWEGKTSTSLAADVHKKSSTLITDTTIERPIVFDSRVTRSYESNYKSLELELGCLCWAVLKAEQYLDGLSFSVITDHSNLSSVLNSTSSTIYSRQVSKFRMLLQPFQSNMTFIHRAGKLHKNVDSLSRLTIINDKYSSMPKQ